MKQSHSFIYLFFLIGAGSLYGAEIKLVNQDKFIGQVIEESGKTIKIKVNNAFIFKENIKNLKALKVDEVEPVLDDMLGQNELALIELKGGTKIVGRVAINQVGGYYVESLNSLALKTNFSKETVKSLYRVKRARIFLHSKQFIDTDTRAGFTKEIKVLYVNNSGTIITINKESIALIKGYEQKKGLEVWWRLLLGYYTQGGTFAQISDSSWSINLALMLAKPKPWWRPRLGAELSYQNLNDTNLTFHLFSISAELSYQHYLPWLRAYKLSIFSAFGPGIAYENIRYLSNKAQDVSLLINLSLGLNAAWREIEILALARMIYNHDTSASLYSWGGGYWVCRESGKSYRP